MKPVITMYDAVSINQADILHRYITQLRFVAGHPFVFKHPAEIRRERVARETRIIIDTWLPVTCACSTDMQMKNKIKRGREIDRKTKRCRFDSGAMEHKG